MQFSQTYILVVDQLKMSQQLGSVVFTRFVTKNGTCWTVFAKGEKYWLPDSVRRTTFWFGLVKHSLYLYLCLRQSLSQSKAASSSEDSLSPQKAAKFSGTRRSRTQRDAPYALLSDALQTGLQHSHPKAVHTERAV